MAERPPDGGVARERRVALRVLRRVDEGAYADRALAAEARRADLDPRTRAQAMRLAYGAVQRRRTLDWLIDGALDRPAALEPAVRDILRLGAYELAFSDGVPPRAAVDQAVRQARSLRGSSARVSARAGVVNAVLRRLADEAPRRLAELEAAGPDASAVRHSMPDWISRRLVASLGAEDAAGVMEAAARPAESALRWNPLRGPRASLERELPEGWRRDAGIPEAYVLPGPFALEHSRAWERGLVIGQSRASQLVARVLAPVAGERILDLCAAPGAKATHIAALSHGGARVTAVELRPGRARGLADLARRMGAAIEVIEGDGLEVDLPGGYDAVLVDPPCTGLGVLSSRPDARWRRREEALAPLAELQLGLLRRALALVRPGGRVVYSTCTLIAEENEEVVAAADAPLDDLSALQPAYAHPRLPRALLTLPHRHGTDGFFIARLRRPA
ncbi:MAG: transcription antitermination factor NusB [Thermoleophilia bacterium]